MARLARAVAVGVPHHVVQRGNRRQRTFWADGDYEVYIELMAEWCAKCSVEVWAYCLMPNHVHLIAAPGRPEGLARAVGEAHRRYTLKINDREGWRGYLWQGRFKSFILDEAYLMTAARYVELNPVRAGLAAAPEGWAWSSARAHLTGRDDPLVKAGPLLERSLYPWRDFLALPVWEVEADILRKHERTGRPLGDPEFVADLEQHLGRRLTPQKPGRKPKPRLYK